MNYDDYKDSDLPGWAKKLRVRPDLCRMELYMRLAVLLVALPTTLLSLAIMIGILFR